MKRPVCLTPFLMLPVLAILASSSGAEAPAGAAGAPAAAAGAPGASFAEQVEAEWLSPLGLAQARGPARGVTTREDAAGACDGTKDGKWGFHTENEREPWWQVDLGDVQPLERILIFNRCDNGMAGRAARLILLLSDDGKTWRRAYQHDGKVFGGTTEGKPLAVPLDGAAARFVRVQLAGSGYLHLDEVEVYGAADATKNLALGRAADQSSVSRWSASHRGGAGPRGAA
ncbi:MAG: discoidin domain-containing protein, partial [Planctomycetes bacterium]|nr:discoidin domain-containing protein [Planctomycetota bacterium]